MCLSVFIGGPAQTGGQAKTGFYYCWNGNSLAAESDHALVTHVLSSPRENLDGVGQNVDHSLQRLDRASRASRQIQHHRRRVNAAHTAAEDRKQRLLLSLAPHAF